MITTLTGNNNYLLNSELTRLRNTFIYKYGDLAYEKLDGEEVEYERLVEASQSLPFLAPEKLVVLRSPSAQKQFQEKVETILKAVPDTTQLVIYEPKIDKRSSYFKVLKSKTDFKELNELDSQELSNWIVQYAKELGGQIKLADSQYLIERVGTDQQKLANEIDKLLTHNAYINKRAIDVLTERTPQSTIFELLDAAFSRNAKRTIEIYKEQRALKVEPQQIVAMLAWQLHVIAVVKAGKDISVDQIAKEAKINPFVVKKSKRIADEISVSGLRNLVAEALELDIRLKTQNIDADDALQEFLINIATSL